MQCVLTARHAYYYYTTTVQKNEKCAIHTAQKKKLVFISSALSCQNENKGMTQDICTHTYSCKMQFSGGSQEVMRIR